MKTGHFSLAVLLGGASILLLPAPSRAGTPGTQTEESYRRANLVLNKSAEALGGWERLENLVSISITAEGHENLEAQVQGIHPEKDTIRPHGEKLVVNLRDEKAAYERRTPRNGSSLRWRKFIYAGDFYIFADHTSRRASRRELATAARERSNLARRIPHLLLLEISRHRAGLRWLGEHTFDGRKHSAIAYPLPSGLQLTLYFDSASHLLTKFEYLLSLPTRGDTVVAYEYPEYRRRTELGWFPTGHRITVGGSVLQQVKYTRVAVNSPEEDKFFEVPAEYFEPPSPPPARAPVRPRPAPGSVTEIGEGVYMLHRLAGFNVVFAEFKEFILAVEAPEHFPFLEQIPPGNYSAASRVTESFIDKIKESVPGKPIRFVVLSHHHSDHAGGARAFLAEGATVLVSPGNADFLKRMVEAPHTIKPDHGSAAPLPLSLKIVNDKKIITDGDQTVEIINVGKNPHTEENLVVYFPKQKILFQSDLFYYSEGAAFPPPNRITMNRFFAQWLRQKKLVPEKIYAFHGLGFATPEHVKLMLGPAFQ